MDGYITGEASPYYLYHPHVAKRICEYNKNMNIIIVLRNPVDRAYSDYNFVKERGHEKRSFEDALSEEKSQLEIHTQKMQDDPMYKSKEHRRYSYVGRGEYIDQIERYIKYFDEDQIHIISSDELFLHPEDVLYQVYTYLGVNTVDITLKPNRKKEYPNMLEETRIYLQNYYSEYNERLYEFLGYSFEWDK